MKTTVDIDKQIARQAQDALGTSNLRETVDAALREVVQVQRRLEAIRLLGEVERFDFDQVRHAWRGED